MNFDKWWATLTPREQKVIGEHNARFVWQEAVFHTVGETDLSDYEDCPVCKQDVMMLTGTCLLWKCGTCGHARKVEPEEP